MPLHPPRTPPPTPLPPPRVAPSLHVPSSCPCTRPRTRPCPRSPTIRVTCAPPAPSSGESPKTRHGAGAKAQFAGDSAVPFSVNSRVRRPKWDTTSPRHWRVDDGARAEFCKTPHTGRCGISPLVEVQPWSESGSAVSGHSGGHHFLARFPSDGRVQSGDCCGSAGCVHRGQSGDCCGSAGSVHRGQSGERCGHGAGCGHWARPRVTGFRLLDDGPPSPRRPPHVPHPFLWPFRPPQIPYSAARPTIRTSAQVTCVTSVPATRNRVHFETFGGP